MREALSGRRGIAASTSGSTTALTFSAISSISNLNRRDLFASLLIALVCFGIYNANGRSISAGDTYPTRYLPFAIWRDHTLALDPIASIVAQGRGSSAFWMVAVPGGATLSLYPVVQPVLLAPLYLPAVAYLNSKGWSDARLDHVARVMEKLAASLVAAVSAALLYLLLRRRVSTGIALALACAYAFGTTTWTISSQALWQHGMAELLGVGALLLLTAQSSSWRAVAAGLMLGLLAGNRPPDAILAVALGAYGLVWAGHFAGAYGRMGRAAFFDHDLLSGLGGLLFSPARGLIVFSPFLLFLAWVWRFPPMPRGLAAAIGVAVILQLLLYAKTDWRGGIYWGPRYLTDTLPMLVWLLAPGVAALRTAGRTLFGVTTGASILVQAIGAFWFVSATDGAVASEASAWRWHDAPFVAALRHGPAPADLWLEMQGSFDSVEIDGRPDSAVEAGDSVVVAGWALAGRATPNRVAISLDGHRTVSSRLFYERPDVNARHGAGALAGWRIPLRTDDLVPGEHRLTALAWASDLGDARYLGEKKLVVRKPAGSTVPAAEAPGGGDLSSEAKTAAERVREHQQEGGYWLTTYTSATRYETPHVEMNTFTTSLVTELLEPLAARIGLEGNLARARAHLTAQIEADGLVRYHGLPDGPGMGTLGCPITPDSDDTALVWRIAPDRDRQRLEAALATLERYRTPEGLYRTWLAPREAYQCLDPGSDPNPADVAIQMHLILLFSEAKPPAAWALCKALRSAIDRDRIWVYYAKAPLVPILRRADLGRAGCSVELPAARMRSTVAGQEVWTTVARRVGQVPKTGTKVDSKEIESVLRELAAGDFALLRKEPPLLYHNDLSATVSRFYWSEDVGYALWLRLYDEFSRARRSGLR